MTGTPLDSASTRREILSRLTSTRAKLALTLERLDRSGRTADAGLDALHRLLRDLHAQHLAAYRAWLPRPPLSRCPFTGSLVRHSLDVEGLDGPWWNYDSPVRPMDSLPPTFFGIRGAMRLARNPESTPFLAIPGPEVPYVLPRLLAREEMAAVISSLPVGPHRAYVICYYAHPIPKIYRVNDWAMAWYAVVDRRGLRWQQEREPSVPEMDFELEPWIARGKLLWIAPDDARARLRSDAGACPYLELAGRRAVIRVQGTAVWTDADVIRPAGSRGSAA